MRFMYIDWQSIISKEIVSWLICLFLEWCFIKLNPVMFLVHNITRKWDLPNMHKACGASECEHARSMGYLSIEDSLYSPDARWCNLLSVLFVVLLAAIDILFGWTHCGRWCWNEFRFHRFVCMVCKPSTCGFSTYKTYVCKNTPYNNIPVVSQSHVACLMDYCIIPLYCNGDIPTTSAARQSINSAHP